METQVQYATTSDGVSIAFASMGEGPPLVHMPHPFSHLQLDLEITGFRSWCDRLAERRTLVRYDNSGSGLSDRDVMDFSPAEGARSLEAVVDNLGLDQFALWAPQVSGQVAITYAVRHPERVTHLILWHSYARNVDYMSGSRLQALLPLADADWETFTETMAHVAYGWSEGAEARQWAAIVRESVTQEAFQAGRGAAPDHDVTELLPQVRSPTLVLHRRQVVAPPLETARGLASRIPNARLILLEGAAAAPYAGDAEPIHRAIDEFLGDEEETTAASEAREQSVVRTILFTDLVGHTEMMTRLGDKRGREVLREHEGITREAIKGHGGTEVKTMGDGFMASFNGVTKAVECAIALQRAFANREGEPLAVRIGLNAGEPIEEDGDLFGATVILASRIAAKAEGGEILVADTIRGLCSGKGFLFADRGEFVAKGFEEPVRLFEVRWRENG